MFKFLITKVVLVIFSHSFLDIISLEIKYSKKHQRPTISFLLSELNERETFYLNTYLSYTLLRINSFNTPVNVHYQKNKTFELLGRYETISIENTISINQTIIPNFFLYLMLKPLIGSFYEDKGFAFGYEIENINSSLVHLLYKNGHINEKQFAFYSQNENEGLIYLGEVPNNLILNHQHHGVCNIDQSIKKWGCMVKTLKYKDNLYHINVYSIFNTGFTFMIRSNALYNIMTNSILKKEIENGDCSESDYTYRNKIEYNLICYNNISVYANNVNIEIEFDKMSFTLSFRDLFEAHNRSHINSLFWSNPFDNYNKDNIIFGAQFLNKFKLSIFNYETKQIHLYSDSIKVKLTKENIINMIIIKIIIVLLLFTILIYMFIILRTKHSLKSDIK